MEESSDSAFELLAGPKRSFTILTVGASGTGKSALINGLVGKEVAEENGETLVSQTRHINRYYTKKKDIDINIWDTPGMEVAKETGDVEKLIQDIQNEVHEVDLILFCTNMTSARFRQGDNQNVRIITKAFGESIWKNAVFVLTFANVVKPPPSKKNASPAEYFEERLSEWNRMIRDNLRKNGVSDVVAESVKIAPAGYNEERSLPGRKNWFSDFWHTCLEATKDGAQVALLEANLERLKTEIEVKSGDFQRPLNDQPIITKLLSSGSAGLAIGASIGAVVGSVVGGIIPGGALGCVVGAGCGVACHMYLSRQAK